MSLKNLKTLLLGLFIIFWVNNTAVSNEVSHNCKLYKALTASGAEAPKGHISKVGIDFHLQENYGRKHLYKFKEIGTSSYGFEFLIWNMIEPKAPINGVHNYDWTYPDEVITKIEKAGGDSLIKIWVASTWANREGINYGKTGFRPSIPPHEDFWDDYGAFVHAVVERYDGDGYQDMPGLRFSHRYYQFEGEPEVHWFQGGGTEKEYLAMLELFCQSVKSAEQNAFILAPGFNVGDVFDHNPTVKEINSWPLNALGKKVRQFLKDVVAGGAMDIISTNCNRQATGLPARIRMIKSLTDKPVVCVDMATGYTFDLPGWQPPLYTPEEYPYLVERQIEGCLRYGTDLEVVKWAQGEQSKHLLKKLATALSNGYERCYLQWIAEVPKPAKGWVLTGLLDDNNPDVGLEVATPRPAYYTLKMFNEMMKGVLLDLNPIPPGKNPHQWVWMVGAPATSTIVLWKGKESVQDTIDLTPLVSAPTVRVVHIVKALDGHLGPIYPQDEWVPADAVPVMEEPVFIEAK